MVLYGVEALRAVSIFPSAGFGEGFDSIDRGFPNSIPFARILT
jgi:hypothetical protein